MQICTSINYKGARDDIVYPEEKQTLCYVPKMAPNFVTQGGGVMVTPYCCCVPKFYTTTFSGSLLTFSLSPGKVT